MAKITAKVESRIKEALKRFQPVIAQAKARDVGEADTSTLCKDVISDLFGYDKYTEITAEYQIKGTYCDLALQIDGKLAVLIEVKAINSDLKESYVKQAVDYGANQGIEWVILTNAQVWQVYRINFGQPVTHELLMTLDFNTLSAKSGDDLEALFLLTREAQGKSLLDEYHEQRQAMSKFSLGAVVLSEPVLAVVRRELRRMSPDVKIEIEEIERVLAEEVIKREVLEGDRASAAKRKVTKIAKANKSKEEPGVATPSASSAEATSPTVPPHAST